MLAMTSPRSSHSPSYSPRYLFKYSARKNHRSSVFLKRISFMNEPKNENDDDVYDETANDNDDDDDDSAVLSKTEEEEKKTVGQLFIENVVSSPLFYVTGGTAVGVLLTKNFGDQASVLFSALPIVFLTMISKSTVGEKLLENAQRQRLNDQKEKVLREERRAVAIEKSAYYGSDRQTFSFINSEEAKPKYLTGDLPGDYAFDPLGLSNSEEKLKRNVELELLHGRWAMLAVVGVCLPEALSKFEILTLEEPIWFKIGKRVLDGIDVNYLGIEGFHIAGASGIIGIAFCQLVLMGGPEYARYVGIESLEPVGVYLPGDINYPGGAPFDPFNMSGDAENDVKYRVAEVKHGRLAMLAMLGCFVQAYVTKVGPVQNLIDAFRSST